MINIRKLDYSKPTLIDMTDTHKLFIEKTFFKALNTDQYFIKLYKRSDPRHNGNDINQGYMYFAVDYDEKQSHFIGTYIKPEYRGNGYSSLLVSKWIQVCFENGITDLTTISKQRKPFILYLLKCFTFELNNPSCYQTYGNNIYVCRNSQDKDKSKKYLVFQNKEQETRFIRSPIAKEDSYHVLPGIEPHIILLDTVLLNNPYDLQDENEAYQRSMKRYDRFVNKNS